MSEDSRKNCNFCEPEPVCHPCDPEPVCEDKCHDKEDDCCCDISILRRLLEFFRGANIRIRIIGKEDFFDGFVREVTCDTVSLSATFNGPITRIYSLCNVVRFNNITTIAAMTLDSIIAKIRRLPDPVCHRHLTHKCDCCCTNGIACAIRDFARTGTGTITLVLETDGTGPDGGITPAEIIEANESIVAVFRVATGTLFIYPTCHIDSIRIP